MEKNPTKLPLLLYNFRCLTYLNTKSSKLIQLSIRDSKMQHLTCLRYRLPASTFSSWLTDHRDQRGELPHQSLWKLLKKYGHVMLLKLTIIISSPETEKQVLRDHDLYCCSSPSDEEANLSIAIEHRDLLQL
ncbi:hypothetical protein YC2023_017716 [Brassica napus]